MLKDVTMVSLPCDVEYDGRKHQKKRKLDAGDLDVKEKWKKKKRGSRKYNYFQGRHLSKLNNDGNTDVPVCHEAKNTTTLSKENVGKYNNQRV